MQLKAVHSGLRDTTHPLFFTLGDEFRFRADFIRLGVDEAFVQNIRSVELSEFRPTPGAVVVIPFFAFGVVLKEAKGASLQPPQPVVSRIG